MPLLVEWMEFDFDFLKKFDFITHIFLFYLGIFQECDNEGVDVGKLLSSSTVVLKSAV